jgi:hypothetical protein
MNEIETILEILKAHEARSDSFEKELNDNHVEWQRDRGRYIRLEAQIEALLSLVTELAVRSGVSPAHVATCFRERYLRIQEQRLLEYEKADPALAARIDNRVEGEIPTNQNFRPLFPDEK